MKTFTGRVGAITGAAAGIGRALAIDLASRGCHLALSDVDTEGLAETVQRCEGHGVKVTSQYVDVADRDAMMAWADAVVAEHGSVNMVFNNAGVAVGYDVATMSFEDWDWLIGINLGGVVNGTKAFLPHLEASGEGHVINISSVFGLISVPGQSAYNAAKFAVRGFTDCLRMELDAGGSCVSSTTVHPGGIKTNIARNGRLDPEATARSGRDPVEGFDRLARTTPEKAAEVILGAVERDRRRVVIGADGVVIDLISRLPGFVYQVPLALAARRGLKAPA